MSNKIILNSESITPERSKRQTGTFKDSMELNKQKPSKLSKDGAS